MKMSHCLATVISGLCVVTVLKTLTVHSFYLKMDERVFCFYAALELANVSHL